MSKRITKPQLLSEFEVQARYDIARMKAGELTQEDCADLITNHCVDYCTRVSSLRVWWRWLTRYEMRKLRDRLVARLPVYAAQGLPDAAAMVQAWRDGATFEMEENADGTMQYTIKGVGENEPPDPELIGRIMRRAFGKSEMKDNGDGTYTHIVKQQEGVLCFFCSDTGEDEDGNPCKAC